MTLPTTLSLGSESISLSIITWLWGRMFTLEKPQLCVFSPLLDQQWDIRRCGHCSQICRHIAKQTVHKDPLKQIVEVNEHNNQFEQQLMKYKYLTHPFTHGNSSFEQSSFLLLWHSNCKLCSTFLSPSKQCLQIEVRIGLEPKCDLTKFAGLASRFQPHTGPRFELNTKMVSELFHLLRLQRSNFDSGRQIGSPLKLVRRLLS